MFFRCALVQKVSSFMFFIMPIATFRLISKSSALFECRHMRWLRCRCGNGPDFGIVQVNPHPLAIRTISPTFYNGIFSY